MKIILSLVLYLIAVPALGHGVNKHRPIEAAFVEGRFAPPDVELVDNFGVSRRFMSDAAAGHRVVISFFYADCTEVCAMTNAVMSLVSRGIHRLQGKPVRLISITVAPERDTPEVLDGLAEAMGRDEDWVWLTGPPDNVRRLTHALGMRYERPEDHGVLFVVGDPDSGRFVSTSSLPEADTLLGALQRFGD